MNNSNEYSSCFHTDYSQPSSQWIRADALNDLAVLISPSFYEKMSFSQFIAHFGTFTAQVVLLEEDC